MRRVIKFRAFDEQNLVMHNDFRFIKSGEEGNDWIVFTSDKQLLTDAPHPFDNPYFQQQLKVMQFTGWSDSNGIEIYEGDILEDDEHFYYEISWSDKHACWYASDIGGLDDLPLSCAVIGNIYQNPELLK
jgi:hypothetical protein